MRIQKLDNVTDNIDDVQNFILAWNDENQSITQLSSGSTGPPKSIKIPKWKMEASAKMTGEFLDLDNCETALLCMSTNFIGGKMMLVRSKLYDLQLYVTNVTRNPLKNLSHKIDFVAMVPLQVEETLQENPEKLNLIKHLIIGGAPVSDELIEKIKKFKCNAYSTFGMTETVSHIALRNLKNDDEPYRAIGNTTFSVENECLTIDSEELKIKGLKTTDIVDLIDEKSFHWLGRADFVINSGGVKIHPEEVERKIANVIGSSDFIISQIEDQKLGSKVVFIGENHLSTAQLKKTIDLVLTKYERPKAYFFISSLIKTPSGKIDRNKTTAEIL
ncbi:AMP-binding protein [Brumimicrobium mesophilum]|uniref:AMP-binding protein n=1 Tax=Brumimicrobium mesophilum TaxID=392717 RepID=UPI000D1441BD|nr:AMP-binding protein [Brumimicrobium mesophilum]